MIGTLAAGLYAGGVPPVTSSYESIATFTVGSGGSSGVTFSSIPSTYKHLQIRYSGFVAGDAWIRLNGDTGFNYSRHSLYGNGSSAAAFAGASSNYMGFAYTSSSSNPSVAICDVLDYGNTSKNTTIRVLNGDDQNGSGIIMLASGVWLNTSAVTSMDIFPNSGNFGQYSSIALYGIKG